MFECFIRSYKLLQQLSVYVICMMMVGTHPRRINIW